MTEILATILEDIFWVLILIVFLELILSASWNPLYFRMGIPIYYRKIKCHAFNPVPTLDEIERVIPRDDWPEPEVRRLSHNRFGFREKIYWGQRRCGSQSYTPIMHGCLHFDKEEGNVVIIGFLNWSSALFCVFFMLAAPFFMEIFALVVIGIIYGTQRDRYQKFGQDVAQIWSNFYSLV